MTDGGELARDTARRLPRFRLVVAVLSVVLVLQLIVAAVFGFVARSNTERATQDVAEYLADATVARTAAFMAPATGGVALVADMFERGTAPADADELSRRLYETMHLNTQVDALFVAYPNGDLVHVRRLVNGFETRVLSRGEIPSTARHLRDLSFVERAFQADAVPYTDARLAPWYIAAVNATVPVWTDPYLLASTGEPGVTTAQAVLNGEGQLVAVVGADITLGDVAMFVSSLPLGDGGEAFLLTASGALVAAPEPYQDEVEDALRAGERLVVAADVGIDAASVPSGPEEVSVAREGRGGVVSMNATFPADSALPWALSMSVPSASLSPGLRAADQTSLWGTWLVAALVVTASFFLYQLRHPIDELNARASTDDLTRLANRYEFRRRGHVVVDDAYERAEPVCVAMFDLDDFKTVNDTEGHAAGDRALRAAADALREATGPDDVVARFGGDEFVVVRLVGDEAVPHLAVERIRDHVERGINRRRRSGEPLGVTAGFALSTLDYRNLRSLAQAADAALVAGKRIQKGKTHAATGVDDVANDVVTAPRPRKQR